jgi:hypothetical protein
LAAKTALMTHCRHRQNFGAARAKLGFGHYQRAHLKPAGAIAPQENARSSAAEIDTSTGSVLTCVTTGCRAEALGLDFQPTLLARAAEVIE